MWSKQWQRPHTKEKKILAAVRTFNAQKYRYWHGYRNCKYYSAPSEIQDMDMDTTHLICLHSFLRFFYVEESKTLIKSMTGTITQVFGAGEGECSVILLWSYALASISLSFWSTIFMWLLSWYVSIDHFTSFPWSRK